MKDIVGIRSGRIWETVREIKKTKWVNEKIDRESDHNEKKKKRQEIDKEWLNV